MLLRVLLLLFHGILRQKKILSRIIMHKQQPHSGGAAHVVQGYWSINILHSFFKIFLDMFFVNQLIITIIQSEATPQVISTQLLNNMHHPGSGKVNSIK